MFARHPRIAQALYNHQDALRQWAAQREPSCRCEAIKRYAPEAPAYDGHAVASGFHFQRGRSTLERQLISGSSGDTCFPSKAPMWEQFRQARASWCAANDLPGPPRNLEQVFHALWSQHAQTVASKYHNRIVDCGQCEEQNRGSPVQWFATAQRCTTICWAALSAIRTFFGK